MYGYNVFFASDKAGRVIDNNLNGSITSLESEFVHLLSVPFWVIKSLLAHKNDEKEKRALVLHKSSQALLTLEDVYPVWSKKIRHRFDETDKFIMSRASKHCLVGEAWGFSGRHAGYYIAPLIPVLGCWTCVMYGYTMGTLSRKKESQVKDFEPIIAEFLKHWNEKPKNITEKGKDMSFCNDDIMTSLEIT